MELQRNVSDTNDLEEQCHSDGRMSSATHRSLRYTVMQNVRPSWFIVEDAVELLKSLLTSSLLCPLHTVSSYRSLGSGLSQDCSWDTHRGHLLWNTLGIGFLPFPL